MAMSAVGSNTHAASSQAVQSLASHKHGSHRAHSNSDIDASGSSVASSPSATGKIGSKIDITA
jgi:hypothetical protein